jgi:UDPglucose--hexose-1-phosphate uridylyltransferase
MSDLRKDPVSNAWVILSPEQEPSVKIEPFPRFRTPESTCPFCPGREEVTPHEIQSYPPQPGSHNGASWSVRVIPNRLPVLRTDKVLEREGIGMFDRITGVGAHEVIIETTEHNTVLREFPEIQVAMVLRAWRDRLVDLYKDPRLRYVAIYRNEGRRAGARLSHPHSQITATPMIPVGIRTELAGAREYFEYKERCVFCDLVDQEIEEGHRLVAQNRGFVAFCPFASRKPFETWIVPKRHCMDYGRIQKDEIEDLASLLLVVCRAVSSALLDPDYQIVLKTGPNPPPRRGKWTTLEDDFHWHLEVLPCICRDAGYETATGMFVNPTLPEEAATFLRDSLGAP